MAVSPRVKPYGKGRTWTAPDGAHYVVTVLTKRKVNLPRRARARPAGPKAVQWLLAFRPLRGAEFTVGFPAAAGREAAELSPIEILKAYNKARSSRLRRSITGSVLPVVADLDAVPPEVVTEILAALDELHRSYGGGGLRILRSHTGSEVLEGAGV